jgi:hypothetical protein
LLWGFFNKKTLMRGHLVVGGPERHFFFTDDRRKSWPYLDKAVCIFHLLPTLSVRSVARHGPEVGGALAFIFLINSLPDSITEPNSFYV